MYENNLNMTNDVAVAVSAPSLTMTDKTQELHTMVIESYALSNDIYAILFGNKPEDPEKPESVTCLNEDLDFISTRMKKTLDLLAEIRNRIG